MKLDVVRDPRDPQESQEHLSYLVAASELMRWYTVQQANDVIVPLLDASTARIGCVAAVICLQIYYT